MAIANDLWSRYGALENDDIPPEAWTWAQHSVLDWFGCALAGSREQLPRLLKDEYADHPGSISLIGGGTADVRTAALINGAAGHALDFDDSNRASGGFHPSAPTLPAALAVAQAEGSSGAEFVAAVVTGIEFGSRINVAMGVGHFRRGWHPTSTMGVFAATAAAARLMRLDAEQFGNAFGIAASLSAGMQGNFGTMAKPLHAGLAAQAGVTAARLGRRGVTARADALEATAGLAEVMGADEVNLAGLDAFRDSWIVTQTLFKYHAACFGTHAPMEATRRVLDGIDPGDVDSITIQVNAQCQRICKFIYPETGMEAKFSLRATTAMTVLGDDTGDPATFSDRRVKDDDLVAMMHRIGVEEVDLPGQVAIVRLETRDGERRETRYDGSIPATDAVTQEARLRAKFAALAEPIVGDRAGVLADRLLDVRSAPSVAGLFEV